MEHGRGATAFCNSQDIRLFDKQSIEIQGIFEKLHRSELVIVEKINGDEPLSQYMRPIIQRCMMYGCM